MDINLSRKSCGPSLDSMDQMSVFSEDLLMKNKNSQLQNHQPVCPKTSLLLKPKLFPHPVSNVSISKKD